jgi:hypothetical protein
MGVEQGLLGRVLGLVGVAQQDPAQPEDVLAVLEEELRIRKFARDQVRAYRHRP